jgi:hypothetical protein
MRKYINMPIEELVSDVPVDQVHVRELADSIMSRGQLSPAIVREETKEVIDGFHRIAAMKELGFKQVECVLTPCDDEGFWDFRIIQASLHKNVTFARAIDWMDKVFQLSPWKGNYKNPHMLFEKARDKTAPKEVQAWAEKKAKVWGLAVATIAEWLETKEKLQPEVLEEAKRGNAPLSHYREIAHSLPTRPELHKPLIEKAEKEELSQPEIRRVAQALRRAEDKEEVESILRQPVSRTEEQMVREAKVEKILSQPREITPLEKYQQGKHEEVLYKLDLLGIINSSKAQTRDKINTLTPAQKEDVYRTCEEAIVEIRRVMEMIKRTIEVKALTGK